MNTDRSVPSSAYPRRTMLSWWMLSVCLWTSGWTGVPHPVAQEEGGSKSWDEQGRRKGRRQPKTRNQNPADSSQKWKANCFFNKSGPHLHCALIQPTTVPCWGVNRAAGGGGGGGWEGVPLASLPFHQQRCPCTQLEAISPTIRPPGSLNRGPAHAHNCISDNPLDWSTFKTSPTCSGEFWSQTWGGRFKEGEEPRGISSVRHDQHLQSILLPGQRHIPATVGGRRWFWRHCSGTPGWTTVPPPRWRRVGVEWGREGGGGGGAEERYWAVDGREERSFHNLSPALPHPDPPGCPLPWGAGRDWPHWPDIWRCCVWSLRSERGEEEGWRFCANSSRTQGHPSWDWRDDIWRIWSDLWCLPWGEGVPRGVEGWGWPWKSLEKYWVKVWAASAGLQIADQIPAG